MTRESDHSSGDSGRISAFEIACSTCRWKQKIPYYPDEGYPFEETPEVGATVEGFSCQNPERKRVCSDLFEIMAVYHNRQVRVTDGGRERKNPLDRVLDAKLHLKMSREGPLEKADKRIRRAERELEGLIP